MQRQAMQSRVYQNHSGNQRIGVNWPRLQERLVYLPGAMVLIYGLWLSLTA